VKSVDEHSGVLVLWWKSKLRNGEKKHPIRIISQQKKQAEREEERKRRSQRE
jgi:hypothetical protein